GDVHMLRRKVVIQRGTRGDTGRTAIGDEHIRDLGQTLTDGAMSRNLVLAEFVQDAQEAEHTRALSQAILTHTSEPVQQTQRRLWVSAIGIVNQERARLCRMCLEPPC